MNEQKEVKAAFGLVETAATNIIGGTSDARCWVGSEVRGNVCRLRAAGGL